VKEQIRLLQGSAKLLVTLTTTKGLL